MLFLQNILVAKIAGLGVAKVTQVKLKCTNKDQVQHILCLQRLWRNRPHYGKPVDVFSLACMCYPTCNVWSMARAKRFLCEEHWRHNDCLHRNARWDKYITVCVQLGVVLAKHRKFRCLCVKLNKLKVTVEKQVPFAADNKFELHAWCSSTWRYLLPIKS